MATRSATRPSASASSSPAPPRRPLVFAQSTSSAPPQLLELRRQWKWAAFSQFFHTFAHLIALEDVSLVDVENDLVNSTMLVMPRLMQRLLVTLSQDRKITVANWQTALRRQYLKRDPAANPIGFEPVVSRNSRAATVEAEIKAEEADLVLADDVASKELNDKPVSHVGENKPDASDSTTVKETRTLEYEDATANVSSDEKDGITKDEKGTTAHDAHNSIKDWTDLAMLEKLDSIHALTEWHFHSPLRLRSIMRSDDENASWRVGPIGYDSKKNAYWFIGLDRLWIQHSPPKPPKKLAKRKAASSTDNRKAKVPRVERADGGRRTKERGKSRSMYTLDLDANDIISTPRRNKRDSRRPPPIENNLSQSSATTGRARAAKTQANVMLDLQAKQLAAAKAEMESYNRRQTGRNSPAKPSGRQTLGIRLSRRLRGVDNNEDDEWQPVPEEWLPESEGSKKSSHSQKNNVATRTSSRNKPISRSSKGDSIIIQPSFRSQVQIAGLDGDESDLTELSESEPSTPQDDGEEVLPVHAEVTSEPENIAVDEQLPAEPKEPKETPGFIEWETICVSLEEWEAISHRFEKATHYLEKALHKVLAQEVVPFVTANLREMERQRIKEEALMSRKRSSRIAVKESEKEAARLAAAQQLEESEKMARMRRSEARSRREEEERLKREQAREQRRKEREEREFARSHRLERNSEKMDIDQSQLLEMDNATVFNHASSSNGPAKSRVRKEKRNNKQTVSSDNWELDCEICGAKGLNRDDGVPLMSCGKCNKWQHISCHDAIDREAGRPMRNWDDVDFLCKHCLAIQSGKGSSCSLQAPNAPNGLNGRERHSYNRSETATHTNGSSRPVYVDGRYVTPDGSSNFAGFAHYQPQQRGFSPHPSIIQPQPHALVEPHMQSHAPMAPVASSAWRSQAWPGAFPTGDLNQEATFSSPHRNLQNDKTNGLPSEHRQVYGIPSNSTLMNPSAQMAPYSHAYYHPPQQTPYSNSTSLQR